MAAKWETEILSWDAGDGVPALKRWAVSNASTPQALGCKLFWGLKDMQVHANFRTPYARSAKYISKRLNPWKKRALLFGIDHAHWHRPTMHGKDYGNTQELFSVGVYVRIPKSQWSV